MNSNKIIPQFNWIDLFFFIKRLENPRGLAFPLSKTYNAGVCFWLCCWLIKSEGGFKEQYINCLQTRFNLINPFIHDFLHPPRLKFSGLIAFPSLDNKYLIFILKIKLVGDNNDEPVENDTLEEVYSITLPSHLSFRLPVSFFIFIYIINFLIPHLLHLYCLGCNSRCIFLHQRIRLPGQLLFLMTLISCSNLWWIKIFFGHCISRSRVYIRAGSPSVTAW